MCNSFNARQTDHIRDLVHYTVYAHSDAVQIASTDKFLHSRWSRIGLQSEQGARDGIMVRLWYATQLACRSAREFDPVAHVFFLRFADFK